MFDRSQALTVALEAWPNLRAQHSTVDLIPRGRSKSRRTSGQDFSGQVKHAALYTWFEILSSSLVFCAVAIAINKLKYVGLPARDLICFPELTRNILESSHNSPSGIRWVSALI